MIGNVVVEVDVAAVAVLSNEASADWLSELASCSTGLSGCSIFAAPF